MERVNGGYWRRESRVVSPRLFRRGGMASVFFFGIVTYCGVFKVGATGGKMGMALHLGMVFGA